MPRPQTFPKGIALSTAQATPLNPDPKDAPPPGAGPEPDHAPLAKGALDYAFVYESSARGARLRWLPLPAAINLGDDARAASYESVSIRVPGTRRGDTIAVRGTPIRYAMSIPEQARHRAAAEQLVAFLLSSDGRDPTRGGSTRNHPLDRGTGVPAAVSLRLFDSPASRTPR